MLAILLATGESNKLWPLTEIRPSPLLPVANRPVMDYAIELLARQGIRRIVVSLYRHPDQIEAWAGSGRRWGIELEYVLQREAWGTAGTLRWAEGRIDERFLVLPADRLADVDIGKMVAQHQAEQNLATFHWHREHAHQVAGTTAHAGYFGTDLAEDRWPLTYATGVCLLEPEALNAIPPRTSADLINDLIPTLLDDGFPVGDYHDSGYYNPLTTFAEYQAAQEHYLLSNWDEGRVRLNGSAPLTYPKLAAQQVAPGIWSGKNNVIHPEARLAPPVYIGENCQIGRNVELGPAAVIGDHVVIGQGASVYRSTILDHTYVGELVKIEKRLVQHNLMIDTETGDSTRVSDRFLLDRIHPAEVESLLRRTVNAFGALLLLSFLFPLILALAIVLRLTTGAAMVPVIRQAGDDGRTPVTVWHLNTRRPSGGRPWLGALVERLEWYRLPELWAVLRGQIALVGVKPLAPEEAALVTEEWYQTRYEQPAGFTGLWYVQNAAATDDIDATLISDTYYAATRTWGEDMRLLLRTPVAWWRRVRNWHRGDSEE